MFNKLKTIWQKFKKWIIGFIIGGTAIGMGLGGIPQDLYNNLNVKVYTNCNLQEARRISINDDFKNFKSRNADNSLRELTSNERASFKSCEIAKRGTEYAGSYDNLQYGVRVEIIGDVKTIEVNGQNGIEVFARAWKNGQQLGFGSDGSVEIERFRIFNPPILVPDVNGTISRDETNIATKVVTKKFFREDPVEAIHQSLSHTISLTAKNGDGIVLGKIGNTTDTFYPAAGSNSPVDGLLTRDVTGSREQFATIRDAGSGTAASDTGTALYAGMFGYYLDNPDTYSTWWRSIISFDTSTLGAGASISSATLSLYQGTDRLDQFADGPRSQALVGATPASTATLATSDYSQLNTTLMATALAVAAVTSNAYNDFSLNASGIANISTTGVSKFGLKTESDRSNTPQGMGGIQPYEYVNWASADTTGTTQDPKLVVVHSATATATPDDGLIIFE